MPFISQIYVYPVKSLGGISLKEAEASFTGIIGDRQWMLVDANNRFVTQRQLPILASIKTAFTNGRLTLSYPNMDDIDVCINSPSEDRLHCHIWETIVDAYHEDTKIDDWIAKAIGKFKCEKLRMVRFNNRSIRNISSNYLANQEAQLKLADASPYLLTFESSLALLNQKLPSPMPMNRFRPNIVFSGSQPFEEWSSQRLKSVKPCHVDFKIICPRRRCPIPSIDQQTGKITTPGEPTKTLMRDFPVAGSNKPHFGVQAYTPKQKIIKFKIGDEFKFVV